MNPQLLEVLRRLDDDVDKALGDASLSGGLDDIMSVVGAAEHEMSQGNRDLSFQVMIKSHLFQAGDKKPLRVNFIARLSHHFDKNGNRRFLLLPYRGVEGKVCADCQDQPEVAQAVCKAADLTPPVSEIVPVTNEKLVATIKEFAASKSFVSVHQLLSSSMQKQRGVRYRLDFQAHLTIPDHGSAIAWLAHLDYGTTPAAISFAQHRRAILVPCRRCSGMGVGESLPQDGFPSTGSQL